MTRDYPSHPFIAASIAVFRDGKVLLASRRHPPHENVYTLPGGVVETGERLEEAALRELMEEVGVIAHKPSFIAPVEVIERDADGRAKRHMVIMAHVALWKSGEPRTGPEAQDVRWVDLEELDLLSTTPGLREILLKANGVINDAPDVC